MTSHLPLRKSNKVTIYRFLIYGYSCVNKYYISIFRDTFKDYLKSVQTMNDTVPVSLKIKLDLN